MDKSKSFLKQFLTSIVFIYTFGFANQNQIEQVLKTVDKNKNLTGFIPLLEKQSQNSFRHTGISNSIAVHNSRDDFSSVLIDSSFNGYSFISDVTDPLSWAPDAGFLLTYRHYNGDDGNVTWGFIGASQSEDGEEWFAGQELNDNYPSGDEAPNLPTYNGNPQGRYPSASIINSTPVIFWNELTNDDFGGTGNEGGTSGGGYPLYTYNSLGMGEDMYWPDPFAINTGCASTPCDPGNLWLPQIQSVQEEEGADPTIGMLLQQSTSGFMAQPTSSYLPIPDRFYWINSNIFVNGYILWNDPMLLFDFSDNEIIGEYAGRPRFHINDNGVGYFVFSGYGEGYESDGSLQSHTFFILKTTNYGETWEPIGETFNNGSFGFIPDDNLNQSMLDAGLLGGTVQDSLGNDVTLDQAFMGYHYQVFTDEYDELHIITTALPKNSESDSLYVGSPGAGYYHLHNSDPSNPGNWNATMIRDMSDSYKVQIHPSIPTWQYLYADIAVSYTGGTIWTVTSAIRELIPLGNNEYTYDDLDLFGSVSLDNGLNWGDLGNLTDTPSGGANGLNVELHPHLAPLADIGECFLTFQMPASEDDEYDMVMNRIYFATIGLESLSSSGSVMINEIMQNPSAVADDSGEWFEIVNNGNLPINLFEYSIKDAGTDMHTIDDVIVLFPGEFKVFGNNSNPDANGGVTVDYQYSDVSLGNTSDELIILDRDGMVIDSVAWDNGSTFPDPNGASMALVDTSLDNSIGSNWQESTTSYGDGDLGTPGIPNFSSDIALDLTSLDFDTVNVSESGTLDLTISNAGNGSLHVDSLYTTSSLFTLSFTDSVIENSAILNVSFSPTEFGPATATLYIESNDPDEGMLEVSLTGYGYYPSPDIELESTSIDFGGVMDGLTGTQLLYVYNTGDTGLELDTMYCTGNFSVIPGSGTVDTSDNLALEVIFAPDDEASFEGMLTIVAGNDPDEDTLTVSLSGNGTPQAPMMLLSDDNLYFGTVMAGQVVTRQTTIHNTGMLDLEVEELNMAGSELFTTDFSDATVEPGDSVDVVFQFAPTEQIIEAIATATIVVSGIANQTVTLEAGYFGPVWHIATTGSDETGDGSEQNPFATIQKGVEIASDGDSVMVAAGSYFGDYIHIGSEYNKKNIYIIGEDRLTTVFSPEDVSGNALFYWNGLQDEWVDDTYLYIENLTINGKVYTYGVKQLVLNNVKINNNVQTPLMFLGDSLTISNSIIVNNSPSLMTLVPISFPIGSDSSSANLNISQSTFIMSNIHFGGEDTYESSFEFTSCIFWGDTSLFEEPSNYPNLNVTYCNIQGGVEGVGNINVDPLFCDSDSGDYSLAENSPCVGTGENGANMGALDVGCGPYNFSPTEFSLSTPSNNAQITIDDSNMSDGFITFSWGESSDANGDSLVYLMHATSTDLEDFSLDTNVTSIDMSYMEIVDKMSENNITSATIEWTVDVTDGIDTVTANNAPFTLNVDGSDALSALAEKLIPEVFALHQNYPNPFNPTTQIKYDLPEDALVSINIYDLMGRSIKSLVNSNQSAGYRSTQWNATNSLGEPVSAGMYIYMIQAGEFRQTKKMVLLK